MNQNDAKVIPDGVSNLDFITGNIQPVAQVAPVDNPPATDPPPVTPASTDPVDPPLGTPAADPPAIEPPAATTPFVIPQEAVITEEQAMSVLFKDKFKTRDEMNHFFSLAEKQNDAIEPYRRVLESVSKHVADPEIVALENFKKVTGNSNQSVKSLAEKALAETASPLDIMVADIVLRIPSRADRIEETRQELIGKYPELGDGSALSITAESDLMSAKQNLKTTMEKVLALPVAQVDVQGMIQQANAEREGAKNAWAMALDSGINNLAQAHKEVKLFGDFSMNLDLSQMKKSIPDLVAFVSAQGSDVTPEATQKALVRGYETMLAQNLELICETYAARKRMQEDKASDGVVPIGRNPDTPPPAPDDLDKQRAYVLSS